MVSTHLKTISQIGSSPPGRGESKIWLKAPPRYSMYYHLNFHNIPLFNPITCTAVDASVAGAAPTALTVPVVFTVPPSATVTAMASWSLPANRWWWGNPGARIPVPRNNGFSTWHFLGSTRSSALGGWFLGLIIKKPLIIAFRSHSWVLLTAPKIPDRQPWKFLKEATRCCSISCRLSLGVLHHYHIKWTRIPTD